LFLYPATTTPVTTQGTIEKFYATIKDSTRHWGKKIFTDINGRVIKTNDNINPRPKESCKHSLVGRSGEDVSGETWEIRKREKRFFINKRN
jgi:hypothetical protein